MNTRSPIELTLPVVRMEALSKIVKIPVGVPVVWLTMCAVRVTGWPALTLGADARSAVVVAAGVMVRLGGVESV
jgi:hypothetical protein